MFEPIGGSAPKYTGKNMINPPGRHLCRGGKCWRTLGERPLENAVITVCRDHLKSLAAGKMGYTTTEVEICGQPGLAYEQNWPTMLIGGGQFSLCQCRINSPPSALGGSWSHGPLRVTC